MPTSRAKPTVPGTRRLPLTEPPLDCAYASRCPAGAVILSTVHTTVKERNGRKSATLTPPMKRTSIALVLCVALAAAQSPATFADVASAAGIAFTHWNGAGG